MKKRNIFGLLICLTTLLPLSSCSKKDDKDRFHPNGILILNESPIPITTSTYTIDGGDKLEIRTINPDFRFNGLEDVFYQLNCDNDAIFYLSSDDRLPEGKTAVYVPDPKSKPDSVFSGKNLKRTRHDDFIRLTGSFTNNTKAISVSLDLYQSQIEGGLTSYTVQGSDAIVTGDLGNYIVNQVLEINANHPEVNRIVLTEIPGSLDDRPVFKASRMVRKAGYNTHVPANSFIGSGGVNLFTSGVKRTRVDETSRIFVHSWCCTDDNKTGDELPEDHPAHQAEIVFFNEMLGKPIGRDFYFFTLNAASFEGGHAMTQAELTQYSLLTD